MKLLRPPVVAVCILLVVAACGTTKVHGKATAPTTAPSSAKNSDYRTVDVCSFLTKDAFDKVLPDTGGQVDYSDYSNCQLSLTGVKSGRAVSWDVQIDASLDYSDAAQVSNLVEVPIHKKQVLGFTVFEGSGEKSGCVRAFHLPFTAASLLITIKGKALQCEAADAALTSALKTVQEHKAEHYHMPKDSLGAVDLCVEFQDEAEQVLGAEPTATPVGLHACTWAAGEKKVDAMLSAGKWPPYSLASDAEKSTVSGHPVLCGGTDQYAELAVNFGRGPVGTPDAVDLISGSVAAGKDSPGIGKDFAEAIAHSSLR